MKHIRFLLLFTSSLLPVAAASALDIKLNNSGLPADTVMAPDVIYSPIPKSYEIAGIRVSGIPESDDYLIIGFSGLSIGDRIDIPGTAITDAVKRFWRQGLYSKVEINVEKTVGDRAWLEIALQRQPRMSEMRFEGVKGGEKKDLTERLGMVSGQQLTPNIIAQAKHIIEDYYAKKGYKNADIKIVQQPDLSKENQVILDVIVNRNSKVKVHKIYIDGNEVLSDGKIKRTMKKTNESGNLLKLFSQKKFVDRDFEDDRNRIIEKYNELGYRDAKIVHDSVAKFNDNSVDVFLTIDEGKKYYISDISWVGNTIYPTDVLNTVLGIYPGDVYNQKYLNKRTQDDDDAVSSLYLDNGYLFFQLVPIEERIEGDSIALQMRVMEGPQAKVNRVVINGNDQLYEKVIRRELRVRPGELFSKSDLMRSAREIAASGHFDPENLDIRPEPNENDGTVDILFNLTSKANDKIQLSFGWGQTGLTGQLQLSFSNFSIKNLFNPHSYKGIIPRGDGQTLSIAAQTNAQYYQSYSLSFFDPWIGGNRPNSLAVSVDFSRSTGINSQFYNNQWLNAYQYAAYNTYSYNTNYSSYAIQNAYDPNKVLQLAGVTVGFGTRLSWPDDYFQFQASLGYRWYYLKDWDYLYYMRNGTSNSLTLGLTLSRTSIDNPIYTRRGSQFSIDLTMTPPASLFGRKNWKELSTLASYNNTDSETREAARSQLYKWIEYWKFRFKSKTFTPLTDPDGKWTLVMMTRADFGLLGSWNKYFKTPFETFYFGGDGMTGSYTYATETISMRGYENGQFTPSGYEGYAYGKFTFELHFPFLLQPTTTIYALAFAEAGNCWTSVGDFSPFNLKRSAGVGARVYLSILGFLGIDWAYGFDKVWGTRGGSQIHFVLGQEF
ncbi:MAG: outer membrane protein assembly factor BamA [Bacteroidales bacterium]|nr:outer membrane protein assembly factor BamA [Bacteroidales bacterium]MBD5206226.1 outer membrane protein assembly factor BamA [Bacteroidales bacterium]MBD5223460.1 outer membrane protein assembly factor BamA [Bacteroidales bacterium]MBD5302597.1 outer membrane protein assembly factor BamA [Bacteroides sp.]